MTPDQELLDLLARLVGVLDANLLADDAELTAMVGQLVQVLEPRVPLLPSHILLTLAAIDNKIDRFKTAVELVEARDPAKLKQLADSLKEAGLLKNDQ